MATQLVLLDTDAPDWKLDPETREIGRRGVAEAREALRRAAARHAHGDPTSPSKAA
jgi:hypothetical protein